MLLVLVLLRDAYGVNVEFVIVGLREPKNRLVTPGESFFAMKPMAKVPNYPIPTDESVLLEDRVEKAIQRNDFAVFYAIADLPTNAPAVLQYPLTLLDYCLLAL
jgi:hypothetical protein